MIRAVKFLSTQLTVPMSRVDLVARCEEARYIPAATDEKVGGSGFLPVCEAAVLSQGTLRMLVVQPGTRRQAL